MINKSKMTRLLSLGLACAGFVLINGMFSNAAAQTRDPFEKPTWAKTRPTGGTTSVSVPGQPGVSKPKPTAPVISNLIAPPIESRIAYYKNLREAAATNGQEIPKVTSVLTLDELAVTGIFRTPRGFAAMVEAKPIKLSYTIYPGEKFFDGQLVAIEDNRLVFRKVTKTSNNKFISSVENKTLRQYSVEQEVQGTAPVEQTPRTEQPAQTAQVPNLQPIIPPALIISPLEEMNRQPVETEKNAKEQPSKKSKKPVKVAKNKADDKDQK